MKKVYFPKIRLQEMLNRSGGIGREQAVEAAIENLRGISAEGDAVIVAAIAAIEHIATGAVSGKLKPEEIRWILEETDQIVTFAGTFGYTALDRAARGLCDLADGMLNANLQDAAPILVHIRALRMFSPAAVPLGAAVADQVLAELGKILDYYHFQPIA
jgi:hypothetical protein